VCSFALLLPEIVGLFCQGLTNREIAIRLFISVGTVKDPNYTIFQKAGARNRAQPAQPFTQPSIARDHAGERARAARSTQGTHARRLRPSSRDGRSRRRSTSRRKRGTIERRVGRRNVY
jgi:hypothetical protein